MSERATVGSVLSGGASLGAIQGGMLRAIDVRGISPDSIAGTLSDALNGGYIALRDQTERPC